MPAYVSQLIGTDTNVICERYFGSIDKSFPFISNKILKQGILAGNLSETPGLALLLLCMKLATENSPLKEAPANTSMLYRTARNYLNIVEEITPVSIHVFQLLVLIALYEIGHSIFSAA